MTQDRTGTTARKGSPLDGFEPEKPKVRTGRGLTVALWGALGVVVLAGGYVAAQVVTADQIPRGTTVAGLEIGGKSRADAISLLESELGPRASEPISVTAGKLTASIDPAAAGLGLDARGTVAGLTGFSLAPGDLVRTLFGGDEIGPSLTIDDGLLRDAIAETAVSLRTEPVDGKVAFVDGRVEKIDAVPGLDVDVERARTKILGSYLTSTGPVDLPTSEIEPQITQAETDAAQKTGTALVSAPVRVEVDGQKAELPISALGAAATFVAKDGALVLDLDKDAVAKAVLSRTKDLETKATGAKFVFKDGKPSISGGKSGLALDRDALTASVLTAATTPGTRTATTKLVETESDSSRKALEALGVKKVVAEFTTPLTDSYAARNANLTLAAKKITGQLIKPGEEWSLTETLSPITLEAGYVNAGVIDRGRLQDGVGGGLSQMATTTYNAFYFAGVDILEHRPHSFYFTRYPEGRESTMFVGSIDMRIKNDTPYGILIQSWVKDGKVVVKLWSTPHYKVSSTTSPRRDVVQPRTVYSTEAGCIAQGAGSPGFAVTVTRKVSLDGAVVKDESNAWRYTPQNRYVCGPDPASEKPKKSDDD
ncbi:VanW family protein [Sanguibacter sp. HDW7]|uniref:VanW family protein n=1 Tax=Sanguibacter sp. HDW7 TaxID=2714931 RepID=UPI001407FA81|nr:VanW family protein [Sanguibacter sp. HDW7]QIK84037.1 vanomycin resistance protein VanB [Sanguibacter sp. HDW7]